MNGVNARQVTVIDGGFATQLCNHVGQIVDGNPLWSAAFLASNPDAVVATHLDFLRARADMIMTNTYQASVDGFIKYLGLDEAGSVELIHTAVQLARRAIDAYKKERSATDASNTESVGLVGSVGPYGASLHDCSEYTGSYADVVTAEQLRDWHRPRMRALVDAGVDVLAMETIPALAEAEVLVDLLREFPGQKAWLSFSCKDDQHTSRGELFGEAARRCYALNPDQLVAVGVNCVSPRLVAPLLSSVNPPGSAEPHVPLIAYPNSGETYVLGDGDACPDPERGWWVNGDNCDSIHTYVREWLDLGVTYVGGCCRTYDSDIRRIREEVDKWRTAHA